MFYFKTELTAIKSPILKLTYRMKVLGTVLTLSMLSSVATASNDTPQAHVQGEQSEQVMDSYLEGAHAKPNLQSLLDYYCRKDIADQTLHAKYASSERRLIDCMLKELSIYRYVERQPVQQYYAYKGQGWLNFASYQDSQNHRSDAGAAAIQAAHQILEALRKQSVQTLNQTLSSNSDFLNKNNNDSNNVMLMRPDLWAKLKALKEMGGINLTPRELALAEVGLTWATLEHCDRGWRKSAPNFRMASRWLEQAHAAFINQHDSQTNLTLESMTNRYLNQYESYNTSDNLCEDETSNLTLIS